jgi:phosphopentomutase
VTRPPFSRAIVIVIDSLGVGELPDAADYGDRGSHTLGHIARRVPLQIPTLRGLGLSRIAELPGGEPVASPTAAFGRMAERSPGKDSVTGHWELMGLGIDYAFPVFPNGFPEQTILEFERRIGRKTLGNTVASGTVIIEQLGADHMRTGSPIVYTSADSVFQIAAHEDVIPVPELYRQCAIAYEMFVTGMGLGRIIARPFVGSPGSFSRTSNRHDFAVPPAGETVLDRLKAAGVRVFAIGKIADLFAGQGISESVHTASDDEGMDQVERAMAERPGGLIFANLVDFDTVYGHRNNVDGYAQNLERFDARLSELLPALGPDDLLILTADHGNDPTTPSTDHSRERVPILVNGPRVRRGVALGDRASFADVAATIADLLRVAWDGPGQSFADLIVG